VPGSVLGLPLAQDQAAGHGDLTALGQMLGAGLCGATNVATSMNRAGWSRWSLTARRTSRERTVIPAPLRCAEGRSI
jgi:hypothetical protein